MTSDEIKKVREAAESSSYLPSACIMDYVPIMRNFIFSLVGTDGEDSVNEEWLVAAFGLEKVFETESTIKLQLETEKEWHDIYIRKHKNVIEIIGETSGVKCNNSIANCTRYQFRLLAAALGIKRKGGVRWRRRKNSVKN